MRKAVLIGRGKWGKVLLPHLEKRFEVAGVFGREFRIDGGVDVVIVATPIGTHFPIVLEALQKGKHVFCEKPLTIDPDEARVLIELSKARGVQLVTDYTYTFSERLRAARREIGHGRLQSATLVLQRNVPDGKGNLCWTLASHLLAILDMFTDISHLDSVVVVRSTPGIWILFDRGTNSTILVGTQPEREMCVHLRGEQRTWRFTDLADDDNIGYALDYFSNVMGSKVSNRHNLDLAYSVTKIVHDLEMA